MAAVSAGSWARSCCVRPSRRPLRFATAARFAVRLAGQARHRPSSGRSLPGWRAGALNCSIGKNALMCRALHNYLYIFNLLHKNQEYGITGRNCYNSWRNSRVAVGCSLGARRPGWKEQPSQHRAVRPLQRLSRDLPRRSPRRAADGRLALSGSCGPAGELAHLVRSHEVSKNEPPAS